MQRVRYPKEILDAVVTRASKAGLAECRGVISGVRTRRGVEVVSLHDFRVAGPTSAPTMEIPQKNQSIGLMLEESQQTSLMDSLEKVGTPVVCVYKTRMDEVGGSSACPENLEIDPGQELSPGMEYLVLTVVGRELSAARAFFWDGAKLHARDVGLDGE